MTEELRSAMREASESLSAAIEDMVEKMNAVLTSRDVKMAARSVLADKLRKAAGRKDLNWQTLFDALCVKSRGDAVAALAAMIDPKGILTEREREILDIWPKFEDGEPVMVGDEYESCEGMTCIAAGVHFDRDSPSLVNPGGFHDAYRNGERVERPVQSVLDADGVEIKVGDTVWVRPLHAKNFTCEATVSGFPECCPDVQLVTVNDEMGWTCHIDPKRITHIAPDSWERLERDAGKEPCDYFGVEYGDGEGCSGCPYLHEGRDCTIDLQADIIRRAKALAGVEVAE